MLCWLLSPVATELESDASCKVSVAKPRAEPNIASRCSQLERRFGEGGSRCDLPGETGMRICRTIFSCLQGAARPPPADDGARVNIRYRTDRAFHPSKRTSSEEAFLLCGRTRRSRALRASGLRASISGPGPQHRRALCARARAQSCRVPHRATRSSSSADTTRATRPKERRRCEGRRPRGQEAPRKS